MGAEQIHIEKRNWDVEFWLSNLLADPLKLPGKYL